MTSRSNPDTPLSPVGKMLLYRKPQLLTKEDHGNLGLSPPDRPFDFVRNEPVVPLALSEFAEAQRHYPIVFSSIDKPVPLAVMAVLDDRNLFVDDHGQWDPMCYVPAYLRRYPFALSAEVEGKRALVIDRAAPSVSEKPRFPFFAEGEMSEQTTSFVDFCTRYESDRERTRQWSARLQGMGLLAPHRATHTPEAGGESQPLADYICVDQRKLDGLDRDTVFELYSSGWLSAILLHLASLANWRHLVARRASQESAP